MDLVKTGGSFACLEQSDKKILVAKAAYVDELWMLPGGAQERRETHKHCAIRETEEETGLTTEESDLTLFGAFQQRVVAQTESGKKILQGDVFLYHAVKWLGELRNNPDDEISDWAFMSEEEIVQRRSEFYLGHIRMLVHFFHWRSGLVKGVIEGRLADQVVYGSIMI